MTRAPSRAAVACLAAAALTACVAVPAGAIDPNAGAPAPSLDLGALRLGECGGLGREGVPCVAEIPPGAVMITPGRGLGALPAGTDSLVFSRTATRLLLVERREVSQAGWQAVMGTAPSWFAGCLGCPVERVSLYDALAFLNRRSVLDGLSACYDLSQCEGIAPGQDAGCGPDRPWCEARQRCPELPAASPTCDGWRLPTSDEWRWVSETVTDAMGRLRGATPWCAGASGGRTRPDPGFETRDTPIGGVAGDVWEWTLDGRHVPAVRMPWDPPRGPEMHAWHRGGAWSSRTEACTPRASSEASPAFRGAFVGFRAVRTLGLPRPGRVAQNR